MEDPILGCVARAHMFFAGGGPERPASSERPPGPPPKWRAPVAPAEPLCRLPQVLLSPSTSDHLELPPPRVCV